MGNTANFSKQGRNNLFKEEEKELCYCNDSKHYEALTVL